MSRDTGITRQSPGAEDRRAAAPISSLSIRNLGKRYTIDSEESRRLRDNLLGKLYRASRAREFWAVREFNAEIAPGAFVGVVGPNGSGKSTLLKMIAGITEPTEGEVSAAGRVAAMLEVGVGFHPDLSGWENVFLYGAMLGIARREIRDRLTDIVDFAGVEGRYLDMPLKYFSSGMRARLGFSVAVHARPDILLVDEILAVGDPPFQGKCFDRIMEMRAAGKTIILVTHQLAVARAVCDELIWMKNGRLIERGDPAAIAERVGRDTSDRIMRSAFHVPEKEPPPALRKKTERIIPGETDGEEATDLRTGAPGRLDVELVALREIHELNYIACLTRDDGFLVTQMDSLNNAPALNLAKDEATTARIDFDRLVLEDGRYRLNLFFYEGQKRDQSVQAMIDAMIFQVDGRKQDQFNILVDPPRRWTVS